MRISPPRISGNLHNCAFNCALPTLLEKINWLVQEEQDNRLNDLMNDPVYLNYVLLKNLFAKTYGLDEEETKALTWEQLNGFIGVHSFPAQEILFAPVFRNFIAKQDSGIDIPGFDPLNPGYANLHQGIDRATGKYPMLDLPVMGRGFYQPFGLQIELFLPSGSFYALSQDPHHQLDNEHTLKDSPLSVKEPIKLFLNNEHYELQPHNEIIMKEYFEKTGQLEGAFKNVYKATSENVSEIHTNHALNQLFVYVNAKLKSNLLTEASSLSSFAKRGRSLCSDNAQGTQDFAVLLLMIGAEQKVEQRQLYLDYSSYLDALSKQDARNANLLANAIVAAPSELSTLDQREDITQIKNQAILIMAEAYEKEASANFQFNLMVGLAVAGAGLLCVAMLVINPLVAIGLCVVGSAALLSSASMFASQTFGSDEPDTPDTKYSSNSNQTN